jgi:anti-sigma B factor antagonist
LGEWGCRSVAAHERVIQWRQIGKTLAWQEIRVEVTLEECENATVVRITGSVDGLSATQLSSAFAQPVAAGRVRLVADFSRVNYTSSAGLRSLLGALNDSRRSGGDLRISGLQPQVERVLSLAGFTGIMKIFADVESALASYR